MINLIRNILFLSLFLFPPIFSQTIKEIEISGNIVFSDNEIKNWASISEGQPFTSELLDSAKAKIAAELNSSGYFHLSFEKTSFQFSSDSQTVKISLQIEEGTPTYIKKLQLSSEDTADV